jgi:1,4-dihydroxy-2-naphthoate octaprenyltransferase
MTTDVQVTRTQAWLMAARPRTLPAAISPVIVGVALALAHGAFALLPALGALSSGLLIQIGANLANDYFDYVKGADFEGRKGPTRVAQSGLIPLPELRAGIVLVFTLSVLIGLYLVLVGGWPILVIGIASLLSALIYTGGPFPIGYHGLGDLFAFLFFGLAAVCGTYYVQALTISADVFLAAVPPGALITAILIVNNLRDIETDRLAGKRTMAVILGAPATRVEYLAMLLISYLVPVLFLILGWSSAWVLLPILSLPLAARLAVILYRTTDGPPLNRALAGTANLTLIHCLLFALGLAL